MSEKKVTNEKPTYVNFKFIQNLIPIKLLKYFKSFASDII